MINLDKPWSLRETGRNPTPLVLEILLLGGKNNNDDDAFI